MEKIVELISDNMVKNKIIESDQQEIYNFGIECMILKIIHYISYFIIAVILGSLLEFVVMGCSFFTLRKSAGGYHAKTRLGCYSVSCFTILGILLFYKREWNLVMYCILFVIAVLILLIFAPLDNKNKRMSDAEKGYYRKRTRIMLGIQTVAVIVLYLLKQDAISKMVICGMIVIATSLIAGMIQESVQNCSNENRSDE